MNNHKRRRDNHSVAAPQSKRHRRHSDSSVLLRRNYGGDPRQGQAEEEDTEVDESLQLQRRNLNVSGGREFYERAKSRRERHRRVLMSSSAVLDGAVPLGRGGSRGPGLSSDPKPHPIDVEEDDQETARLVGKSQKRLHVIYNAAHNGRNGVVPLKMISRRSSLTDVDKLKRHATGLGRLDHPRTNLLSPSLRGNINNQRQETNSFPNRNLLTNRSRDVNQRPQPQLRMTRPTNAPENLCRNSDGRRVQPRPKIRKPDRGRTI